MVRAGVSGLLVGFMVACSATTSCPRQCGGCCTPEGQCAADCGEVFRKACDASNCAGCCRDGDGSCDVSRPACGGANCSTCSEANPDARCSPSNCQALLACRVELEGEPRFQLCSRADGGVPAGFDPVRSCPAVCNAAKAGALLSCASTISARCADAGTGAAAVLAAQCITPGDGGTDAGCLRSCDDARTACDGRAPLTSFDACMDASAACGLAWSVCSLRCSP